jgi:hypothetical protein
MLIALLQQLKKQSNKYIINVMIHIDEIGNRHYKKLPQIINNLNFNSHQVTEYKHGGKPGYWKIINEAYQQLKRINYDYCIQLPDDVQIQDNFFANAIRLCNQLPNKSSCLNLLNDNRKGPNWTPVIPGKYNDEIIQTGWVDMCFIAKPEFFQMLNYSIMPVDRNWTVTQNKSSGVGKQISERIYNHGLYTYMVKNSLVIHGDHESVMHPGERTTNPLISNYDINTVAAGVASMPQRIKSLKDAVYSILPQVGRLYVYLNNYDTIPDFLVNDKIIVFNSADAFGDIGDVGKFYACENHKGYFFTLDDDLIYPNDYVQKYICAIERLQKKAIVTIHGRNYEPKPVKSYYKGHSQGFRCLNHQQDLELEVTVGGSGVMAWHTSTINFNLWDFKTTNMADIWAAVKAHKNNVPIILLKHSKTWLRESPNYDNSFSIYSACFRKDKVQTDMFNQYLLPELIKSKK